MTRSVLRSWEQIFQILVTDIQDLIPNILSFMIWLPDLAYREQYLECCSSIFEDSLLLFSPLFEIQNYLFENSEKNSLVLQKNM